jgi:hypothetical protein
MVEKINPYRRFIEQKKPFRKHRYRQEYDTKKELIEIVCKIVNCIQLAQGKGQC